MCDRQVRVLVTVGTTEFDQLIAYTSSEPFQQVLSSLYPSYSVTYQIGQTGQIVPQVGNYLRLSPDILSIYDQQDVIISHGGAGTLLYLLGNPQPGRRIIAVANSTLAGNHQVELVTKLDEEGDVLGFNSVEQLARNSQKVKAWLSSSSDKAKGAQEGCVLNGLIFG